jgi:predicted nicotinamide N-methyase
VNALRNRVQLQVELFCWDGRGPHIEPADIVVGADVLYEPRNESALLAMLPRIVAPGGRVLLADPGLRHAAAFLAGAAARWSVETQADPLLPRGGIHRLWSE